MDELEALASYAPSLLSVIQVLIFPIGPSFGLGLLTGLRLSSKTFNPTSAWVYSALLL